MAKTIHERFRKWNSSKNRITQEAKDFIWLMSESKSDCSISSLFDVIYAEREKGFEAGYMAALKHIGGKKS